MHFDITIFGTILCRHFLCQTHISNFAADESSLVSCSQVPLRDLTLTCCPWTWPETWTYRFYAVTSVWIFQCLPAHCALHTADRFRAFVLFSLAISSYTEPSLVSTDKYFCCFFALNAQITQWNNAVGRGMKQMFVGNWICFNTGTKFCSRLAFRVQFKRL